MNTINATQARVEIYNLIASVQDGGPVKIVSKGGNAVLISENELEDLLESLYLTSIPGMAKSIGKGVKIDVKNCKGYESCTGPY